MTEVANLADALAAEGVELDVVGTAEAADILDVERPRIGRWMKLGIMPKPAKRLAATPVWFRADIERLRDQRAGRRRGRGEKKEKVAA